MVIVCGLLFNEWSLALLLSDDGEIESSLIRLIIWVFDILCIVFGILLEINKISINSRKFLFSIVTILLMIIVTELGLHTVKFLNKLLIKDNKKTYNIIEDKSKLSYYQNVDWAEDYWREYRETYEGKLVQFKPYVGWNREEYHGEWVNIDSNGVRKTWLPNVANNKLLPTLYVFGGSTVWGSGARDDYTIPSHLSKLLHENDFDHMLFNYGESAYSITNNIMQLVVLLKNGQIPDHVIFYNGINLVHSAYNNGDPRVHSINNLFASRISDSNKGSSLDYIRIGLHKLIFSNSMIIKVLSSVFTSKTTINHYKPTLQYKPDIVEKLGDEIIEYYKSCLVLVNNLAKGYGFDVIFLWQPVIFTENKLFDEEYRVSEKLYNKQVSELYKYCNRQVSNIKVPNFYNISDVLVNRENMIYIDFAHLTEEGNKIVAEKIISIINEKIKVPNK